MRHLLFLVLAFTGWLYARPREARPVLLPLPQRIVYTSERFVLDSVRLEGDAGLAPWREWLRGLGVRTGRTGRARVVRLELADSLPGVAAGEPEAYVLRIGADSLLATATTPTGLFRALQTVRQLTAGDASGRWVAGCRVTDWPAFRLRGFMHDVGRTFIPLDELKREIDLLSRFKINLFHWHLTENQAWRLESRLYPQLNDSAAMTRQPGRYYTLDEARELARFCRSRHVLLLPEIDMPGHRAPPSTCLTCTSGRTRPPSPTPASSPAWRPMSVPSVGRSSLGIPAGTTARARWT